MSTPFIEPNAITDRADRMFKEEKMLAAIQQLHLAWHNAGNHPNYHYQVRDRLEQEWPTLVDAIRGIFGAL